MADSRETGTPRLVCGICLEEYKEPKILPCSHTFCLGCLEKTVKVHKEDVTEPKKAAAPLDEPPIAIGFKDQGQLINLSDEPFILPLELHCQVQQAEHEEEAVSESDNSLEMDTPPHSEDIDMNYCLLRVSDKDDMEEKQPDTLFCTAAMAEPPRQRVTVKCPVCVREHEVPYGKVSLFETDYEAVQALEFDLLQKSVTKPQACGSCGEAKEMVSHCYECSTSICKECTDLHAKLTILMKHKVVSLSELTSEEHGSRRKQTHMCSLHNEPVTYYCTLCARLICHVCFYEQHQGKRHRVLQLTEADEKLTEEVRVLSKKAKETGELFNEHSKYIRKVELDVIGGEYTSGLKRKISEAFDQWIRQLQVERESILRKVEDHESMTKKEVWAAKDKITTVISNLEAGLRFTEKAQRCANPADRISMNSESSKILAKATKEIWSNDSLPHPLAISKPLCCSNTEPSCAELEEITSDDLDIGDVTSRLGMFQREVKVGRQVHFEISSKVDTILPPSLQILYGKSEKVLESIVIYESETSPNSWTVLFVPHCGGRHCIQVWIGGIEITSKDINVEGIPKIGDKVRPGPDWNPPDTKNLYLEGTVACAWKHRHTVYVNWKQSTGEDDKITNESDDITVPKKSKASVFEEDVLELPANSLQEKSSYVKPDRSSRAKITSQDNLEQKLMKSTKDIDNRAQKKSKMLEEAMSDSSSDDDAFFQSLVVPQVQCPGKIQRYPHDQVVSIDPLPAQGYQVNLAVEEDHEASTKVTKVSLPTTKLMLQQPKQFLSDSNSIRKEHKWGGPDGLYEIELAL